MFASKLKLIIVDDDPMLLHALVEVFLGCGYEVVSANDGLSALAKVAEEVPDVILSDLNMAGMSGFDFLQVIRRRFPVIPVIAMSSAFLGSSVPVGVAADAFYAKSGDPTALVRLVRIMATHRQRASDQSRTDR